MNESTKGTNQRVLYLGTDDALLRRLAPLLERKGIGLIHAASPRAAREQAPVCDLLLIDTAVLDRGEPLKDLVRDLREAIGEEVPMVALAEGSTIEARLDAVRADAAACFVPPVVPSELADRLARLCRSQDTAAARILVVEDSATQAVMIERILQSAGFTVRILNNSLGVIEALDAFQPELILMDLHMPRANGAELAAIIREQDGFSTTPIIFLSDEKDHELQIQALSKGGDAFITKPIEANLLIRAVSQRIGAMRALRERIDVSDNRDPDTGLASRRHFISRLERAVSEPEMESPGNGLMVLALDDVHRLNETLGPGGVGLVNDRIGALVQSQLTTADLGARLDDSHLAVLARRAADGDLVAFAEELRQAIAAQPITVGGKTWNMTVSVGIGSFRPAAEDAISLISRGSEACAEALTNGGNQVVSHSPESLEAANQARDSHLAKLIRHAVESTGGTPSIVLFYQPLVAIQPGRRDYLEVLPVLNVGEAVPLPTEELLTMAEHSGQVHPVDRRIMTQAMTALNEQSEAQPRLRLLVPQRMVTITARDWLPWMRDQISRYRIGQRRPIIEISMQDVLKHLQTAPVPLKILHKAGIKLCLVGVDQNPVSLDLVAELQPELVKLTPELTREIKPEVLNRVIERLKRAQTQIIACGIDKPEQIAPIWASGVNYAQGSMIQEPLAEPVSA